MSFEGIMIKIWYIKKRKNNKELKNKDLIINIIKLFIILIKIIDIE